MTLVRFSKLDFAKIDLRWDISRYYLQNKILKNWYFIIHNINHRNINNIYI